MEQRSTERALESWRVQLFDRLLIAAAVATVIAGLPILLAGDHVHAAQAMAVATACLTMGMARKIPLTLRVGVLATTVAIASLVSIFQMAFAMPSSFLGGLFMVVLVALVRGPVWATAFALVFVAAIIVAGFLFVHGVIEPELREHNATLPASWLAVVATTALCAALAITAIHYFMQRFIRSLEQLKSEADRRIEALEEARELEAQLRQSQKLEAMGSLAGGIAHDFNNLLTAMMGNAALLKMKVSGDSAQLCQGILDASERAATLTRKLLAFSRHDATERHRIDVGRTIEGFLELLSRLLPSTIELRTELGDEAFHILASSSDIEALVMNLCINARDAIGEERGEIVLALSGDESKVVLSIRDTGSGMEPDVRERIFEAFFSTKGSEKGSGLGLAIVQRIVNGLEGDIHVDSIPGRGSEFRLILPRAPMAPANEASDPLENATTKADGEHLLVVDDDEGARFAMQALLEADGYRVTACEDGRTALKLVHKLDDLDAVVTDAIMPGLSGRELLAAFDEEGIDLPVLVCSGYSPELQSALKDRPNRSFLGKPYQQADLRRALRRILPSSTPNPVEDLSENQRPNLREN